MDSRQTICLLNDSFPPLIDGVANVVVNYAQQLLGNGQRSMVVTPAHPQADDSGCAYPVFRYPSLDLRKKTGYMAGIPFSPELAHRITEENVTILHSHCPIMSTLMGRELRQLTGAPLVLTYHTKYDIDIANTIRSKTLQAGSKKALLDNINACDEVWTVSRGAGENLRTLGYEGEYTVMPNGVDLPCERVGTEQIETVTGRYALPADVPAYLYVGRMMWYKGIRIILDALARLKAQGCDFRMVFAGEGADRAEIEAYAKAVGVAEHCLFIGAVTDREALRAWYCRADLFLFPSTFDTNGLVVREAAACSLPSVLIQGSAAAEGVDDGCSGFLIEENAESLCSLLNRVSDQKERMRSVGVNASKELYLSWDDAVRLAMEQYHVIEEKQKLGFYAKHRGAAEGVLRINGELMEGLGNIAYHLKGRS